MLDLSCIVPYCTGVLCKYLRGIGISVNLASTTYQYDPLYFQSAGLSLHPGLVDCVGRWRIPFSGVRRALKVLELGLNLLALSLRFLVSRPQIVHVQYLALLDV